MSFNPITAAQGADGYLAFFTGPNGLAGDNDLFYDRVTSDLNIGVGKLLFGSGALIKLAGPTVQIRNDGDSGFLNLQASTITTSSNINVTSGIVFNSAGALELGTNTSTSHNLATGDVLVGGRLEVDGQTIFDGTVDAYGSIQLSDGNATVPALSFRSEADGTGTGLYLVASGSTGFTSSGTLISRMANTGLVMASGKDIRLNSSSITDTTAALNLGNAATSTHNLGIGDVIVGRDLEVVNDLIVDGGIVNTALKTALDGYGSVTSAQGADGYMAFFTGPGAIAGDNDLFWDRGGNNLGIGTITPATKLHISNGDLRVAPISLNDAATPAVSFGDGDTGFYETSDDWLAISNAGVAHSRFRAGIFESMVGGGFAISTAATTSTNPSFRPDGADTDTGIGQAAEDQLSLIAGGVEAVRITEVVTATTTITVDVNGELDVDGYVSTAGRRTNGQALNIKSVTDLLTLSGATTDSIDLVPPGAVVLGLTTRVTTEITGANSFDISDGGATQNKWGGGVGVTVGSTSDNSDWFTSGGGISVEIFPVANLVRFTAVGGAASFSAGVVRVTVHYIDVTAPTS